MNRIYSSHRSVLLLQLVIAALYAPIPVSSISIVLFLLYSLFNRSFFRNIRAGGHLMWVILCVLFFIVHALSLLLTENKGEGLLRLETLQPFLWLPLMIAALGPQVLEAHRTRLINTFFFASVGAALIALGTAAYYSISHQSFYATVNDDGVIVKEYYFTYLRLSRIIMHPGYLSLYIGMALFLGFDLVRSGRCWVQSKTGGYALLSFLMVFLFLLQGRMNLLAFTAISGMGLVIYFFRYARPLKVLLYGTLVVFSVFLLFRVLPGDVTRRFTEFQSLDYRMDAPIIHEFNGLTLRLAEWHCAWDVIQDHYLTGVGIGDAQAELLQSYERNDFKVGLRRKYNCHNQYLESWLMAGLAAVWLMLALLIYLLRIAYRNRDVYLAMVALYFFMSMFTESMLIRHKAVTLFCVLLPVLVYSSGRFKYEKETVEKREE